MAVTRARTKPPQTNAITTIMVVQVDEVMPLPSSFSPSALSGRLRTVAGSWGSETGSVGWPGERAAERWGKARGRASARAVRQFDSVTFTTDDGRLVFWSSTAETTWTLGLWPFTLSTFTPKESDPVPTTTIR